MTVHLIKLSVGVDDVEHLAQIQARRLAGSAERGKAILRHVTRNAPRRAGEVLDGGSIYWVIKGFIRARQRVDGIEPFKRDDGRPACALILDPLLVRTEIRSFRPFQGWRYLDPAAAPADDAGARRAGKGADEVPEALARELRDLGLI